MKKIFPPNVPWMSVFLIFSIVEIFFHFWIVFPLLIIGLIANFLFFRSPKGTGAEINPRDLIAASMIMVLLLFPSFLFDRAENWILNLPFIGFFAYLILAETIRYRNGKMFQQDEVGNGEHHSAEELHR